MPMGTKKIKLKSPYEEMKASGGVRRGRRKRELTGEQAQQRDEQNKEKNRQRQEARRRAYMVLEMKYKSEFDDLYRCELESVIKERGK